MDPLNTVAAYVLPVILTILLVGLAVEVVALIGAGVKRWLRP